MPLYKYVPIGAFLFLILFCSSTIVAQEMRRSGPLSTQRVTGPINLVINTIGATCQNTFGRVVVEASGGTAPYLFELNVGTGLVQNNGNFGDIPPGDYTVKVSDAAGQTISATVTVTYTFDLPKLSASSFTPISDCNAKDASVELSASGGTPPYSYSIDGTNYQTSNVFTDLYAGSFYFLVKDANGCGTGYNSYYLGTYLTGKCDSIKPPNHYTAANCGNTGMISGDAQPGYTYSIDGVNYQPDFHFDKLPPGLHVVYEKNADGDVFHFVIQMLESCLITFELISNDAACGGNDGELSIIARQGTPPYSYSIDGIHYQAGNTFSNLTPGNYGLSVRDASGHISFVVGTVYDRCPTLSLSVKNATCNSNDGVITATADKGSAPYQYSIDGVNFQSSNIFPGLAAGTYTVTLKDATGFTIMGTVSLKNSCLSVGTAATNESCDMKNGSITAVATRGTPPFQFSLDGTNFQNSGLFTGLAAGIYTITARDIKGETGTAIVTIGNTPGATISVATTTASCANNDGTISITGAGGRTPYQYSIDGASFFKKNLFGGLASGSYTVYVRDANGCLTGDLIIIDIDCPLVTATATDETCNSANGSITVSGSAGTPPYQFSADGINFQTATLFSGVKAGSYTITIKDAVGKINTATIVIRNICPEVTATATDGICASHGGMITAAGTNGTAPYLYSIDAINFQTGNTFSGLADGIYTVTVRDMNGLQNTTTVTVNNFPGPVLSATGYPATCINNNGRMELSSVNGRSPLMYSVDGVSFQKDPVFNNLPSGDYMVIVSDANGCTDNKQLEIGLVNDLTVTMGGDPTICEGDNVQLPVNSNGSSFNWSPDTGLDNPSLLNPFVSPTNNTSYTLTARLGICEASGSVTVIVNPAPIAYAGEDVTICYGKDAYLSGSGGLTYQWLPSTYLDNIMAKDVVVQKPASMITYSLVVKDANGCQSLNNESVTVSVTPPAKVFAGNDTAIIIGQPHQLVAQDINSSGFVDYRWSPATGLNSPGVRDPVATVDRDTRYTVTARTSAGCEGTDEVLLKVYQGPEIYVPTAFTPNNDGRNDILRAIPIGIKKFRFFSVYNRWGERIFYTTDPSKGWDGQYQGAGQKSDVFVWIVEGVDIGGRVIQKKGTVMLIR